ncbi:MAG: hypothetical protein AAFP84_15050 [Actinomycetota bacterium]
MVHPIEHLRYVARAHGVDAGALVEETAHALGSLHFDPSGLVVACRRIVERHPFGGPLWWLCSNVVTSSEPFEAVWELAEAVRADPTPSELADALPEPPIAASLDAEREPSTDVITIGDPSVVGAGLARRGDVRVLAIDVDHSATSFVRRLERYDVEYEPVDAGAAGAAVGAASIVLVEALAVDATRAVVPIGSSTVAGLGTAFGVPVWLVAGLGRRLPTTYIDAMVDRYGELAAEIDPWSVDVEVIPTSLCTHVVGPHGVAPLGPPALQPECPHAAELLVRSPT